MIKFIEPYFDNKEKEIFASKKVSSHTAEIAAIDYLLSEIGESFILTGSGTDAIEAIVKFNTRNNKTYTIAIPDAVCGSVHRAVNGYGMIHLMDTDSSWNCIFDSQAVESDILLFADLSGKRIGLFPNKRFPSQIIIEDACQCYDKVAGFRDTDYSVFSFSKPGKQMYAGGGGIIYTKNDISELAEWMELEHYDYPEDWQIVLMASQLKKIDEINERRRHNGLYILDHIRDLDWLTRPHEKDHSFLKFIIFIKQTESEKETLPGIPGRTQEIANFINHMYSKGVQVEETYIPLHVRFPEAFPEEKYLNYQCDHTWIEAITLPCRPDLTYEELDQIIAAVRSYKTVISKKTVKQVYTENYTEESFKPAESGYFKELFDLKLNQVIDMITDENDEVLDIGCGMGEMMLPLIDMGINVSGLDFVERFLAEVKQRANMETFDIQRNKLYNTDVTDMKELDDESFDLIYSFSTLYYVSDVKKALSEICRILKPQGHAILEFGNINSLGDLEARRSPTGVKVSHMDIEILESEIFLVGFTPIKRRCFQIFPLYGGLTNYTASIVVPALRKIMATKNDEGIMLDETVSSSFFIDNFAFRQMYVLQKESSANWYPSRLFNVNQWDDQDMFESVEKAGIKLKKQNTWNEGMNDLEKLLTAQPNNPLVIYMLMSMHEGEKESKFSRRFIEDAEIYRSKRKESMEEKSTQTFKSEKTYPVSIVLPTYNQVDMLAKCIQSLEAQTYKDFELIIVNDGSTDDTKDFLGTIQQEFTECCVKVIHQENKKLPRALNTGFKKAQGDYLTWVSSDCYLAPNMIETLVKALESQPTTTGMAYADFFLIDKDDKIIQRISNPGYSYKTLMIRNDGNAAFMYRRECMDKIGMYDEELNGAEDWDYWIRIAEHFNFVYVPEALYYYRLHAKSMQQSIPQEVNESIFKMFDKITKRSGTAIDLRVLYPSLMVCKNKERALSVAALDFGTLLVHSRINRMQTAALFIAKAVQEIPDLYLGWLNLAICNAFMEKWDVVKTCTDHLQSVYSQMNEVMQKMFDFAVKIFKEENSASIRKIPLLTYQDISKTEELYLQEEMFRRVYLPK